MKLKEKIEEYIRELDSFDVSNIADELELDENDVSDSMASCFIKGAEWAFEVVLNTLKQKD